MRSREVLPGRTIAAVFDHGEDFYDTLDRTCRTHNIRQGYIPTFIAALAKQTSSAPANASTTPTPLLGPKCI